jgi:hypothetical protein
MILFSEIIYTITLKATQQTMTRELKAQDQKLSGPSKKCK